MAKGIGDLPEEMLVEIFELLDGKTVKEAALVCKEWNRVISTAPPIMKKFILRVTSYHLNPISCEGIRQLMTLERKFTSAQISMNKHAGERLTGIAERFGNSLRDLELSYWDDGTSFGWNPAAILMILKNTPKLQKLKTSFYPEHHREDPEVVPVPVILKQLKQLDHDGMCDIWSLIEAPQLVELKSLRSDYMYWILDLNFKSFGNFPKSSVKLESLETELGAFNDYEPGFPFKLKKLVGLGAFSLTDNIKKFLLSQAATVETLEAQCDDSKFHELVLSEFKRLRTLNANLDKLTAPENFFSNLKPMPLLTELSSLSGFSSETALRAVLGNCPALEERL